MKKIVASLVLFLATCISTFAQTNAVNFANLAKYGEENQKIKKSPQAVFLGNSITEGWAATVPEFFQKNNFVGRGISGQTSSQLLLRFRQDVINLKPKKVIINIGTNDVAENSGTYNEAFTVGNIESMIELAKQNKIKPIVASVLPATAFGWRPAVKDAASKIVSLNIALKTLAAKLKVPYLDYHSTLKNQENGLSKELADDGVHPNRKCFDIMAQMALKILK